MKWQQLQGKILHFQYMTGLPSKWNCTSHPLTTLNSGAEPCNCFMLLGYPHHGSKHAVGVRANETYACILAALPVCSLCTLEIAKALFPSPVLGD